MSLACSARSTPQWTGISQWTDIRAVQWQLIRLLWQGLLMWPAVWMVQGAEGCSQLLPYSTATVPDASPSCVNWYERVYCRSRSDLAFIAARWQIPSLLQPECGRLAGASQLGLVCKSMAA